MKKRIQNGKRSRKGGRGKSASRKQGRTDDSAVGYEAGIVDHVKMVTSLIEGRKVSRREVIEMLERAEKRQQGIGEQAKGEYGVREPKDDTS